jgi:hypothetical protein
MSITLEKIIEEVRALSPEEQQQLLEVLERETLGSEQSRRDVLSRSIRGKYRDVLTSSEVFIARKAEEIALEGGKR